MNLLILVCHSERSVPISVSARDRFAHEGLAMTLASGLLYDAQVKLIDNGVFFRYTDILNNRKFE